MKTQNNTQISLFDLILNELKKKRNKFDLILCLFFFQNNQGNK